MGLNVKIGKGGHGYEVYDEEGKYANEFSFSVNGQQIKGYDDFRALYFDAMAEGSAGAYDAATLHQLYEQHPQFKQQIDDQLEKEYYKELSNAVNDYNAKQVFSSPEEAAQKMHELFVPNLVQNLIDNDIINTSSSQVAARYKVSTFAACLQMSRYSTNRAQVISKADYESIMSSNIASGRVYSSDDEQVLHDYIAKAIAEQKCIPILRNISGVQASDRPNVMASFYDENSPRHSCLSHYDRTGCSYLGSVVYFSTGGYEYGSGYSGATIEGFVQMNDKLYLLECPLDNWRSSESACNRGIPEINKFRMAISQDKDFDNRMIEKFMQNGNVSDSQAKTILNRLKTEISRDPGLCAMLMGYDAIYGISYQFDLLNLGIATIIKQ